MAVTLVNGGFEATWSEESSHHGLRVSRTAEPTSVELEDLYAPPGWVAWYRVDGKWCPPEGRTTRDANLGRVRAGEQAYVLAAANKPFDGGLMQAMSVNPGDRLRFTVWAHAWSNFGEAEGSELSSHPDDPRWSEGAGFEPYLALEGSLAESPQAEALGNATFWVGMDPSGGRNPLADTVVWGQGAHIYNEYAEVPAVEATADGDRVTLFIRVRFQGGFRHQEGYLDDVRLDIVGEKGDEAGGRGTPRIQYERYYVLLPPGANKEWARAVVEATWDRQRYTVGGSADDAGIGDLDSRIVLAVNPELWGGPDVLKQFFAENYPGVRFRSVRSETPAELLELLQEY